MLIVTSVHFFDELDFDTWLVLIFVLIKFREDGAYGGGVLRRCPHVLESVFEVNEDSPVVLAVLFDSVVAGLDIFALEKA